MRQVELGRGRRPRRRHVLPLEKSISVRLRLRKHWPEHKLRLGRVVPLQQGAAQSLLGAPAQDEALRPLGDGRVLDVVVDVEDDNGPGNGEADQNHRATQVDHCEKKKREVVQTVPVPFAFDTDVHHQTPDSSSGCGPALG